MPSTAIFDGIFASLEQEAPDVRQPRRAVEVFTERGDVYLRIGAVEGLDAVRGNYTVKLTRDEARMLIDALQRASDSR